MSDLTDLIKRDIEAVASIYPTAFDLYDEPLARLAARIEKTVADELERLKAAIQFIATEKRGNDERLFSFVVRLQQHAQKARA